MSCCHTDYFRAICCERERLWTGKGFARPISAWGILFYLDRHSRCYAPGLSLLCRGYRLLEIGFGAFYGCFLMNAIGQSFRVICHVFSLRRRCFVRKRRRVFLCSACAVYFCRAALLAGCCRLLRKSSSGKACSRCAGQVFCNRRYWVFLLGSLFIVRRFLPAWRFPGRQTPLAGGLRR